jgi:hypothetical protein
VRHATRTAAEIFKRRGMAKSIVPSQVNKVMYALQGIQRLSRPKSDPKKSTIAETGFGSMGSMATFIGIIVVVLFLPVTIFGLILMMAVEGFGTSFSFL